MSQARYDWWYNAVWMVRNYPTRKQEHEAFCKHLHETASPRMRQMAPAKQREYDAVTRAIEVTRLLPDGDKRVELIRRMYWSGRKLTINAVIMSVGVAECTGKRWHGAFIRLVGECFGYAS